MKRKSNITAWQLNLFEGFDKDIMVMQRDEEEVFDDAIHVFFDKEYYNTYVTAALKYSTHRYAYHEDKLGEVINQVFDEDIEGIVFHVSVGEDVPKGMLRCEKYVSAHDLIVLKDAADSYHNMYMAHIDREPKEQAAARLWTKYVYMIGSLPDYRKKAEKGNTFELMTMKRKKDGSQATAEDFDYESLKIFLTYDSAMRFNPDKKPVSKYKLAMLSQLVKGRFQVIIEPHRNYRIEFDPATLDLNGYLDIPKYDETKARARIKEYFEFDRVYILLAAHRSDYKAACGNPFLMKIEEKNVMMYVFENYDDAVSYVMQNPTLLPVLDGTFPIGTLDRNDKLTNLNVVTAVAEKLGATTITLDADTFNSIVCKIEFLKEASGAEFDIKRLLPDETLGTVMRQDDSGEHYRFPLIPFYDRTNEYAVSKERADEVISHMDDDLDNGYAYLAGCTLTEQMLFMREATMRFENARKENDDDKIKLYNRIMNRATIQLTEELCERPYIYTLRDEDGSFTKKNDLPYLIVTNRFEAGRQSDGKLTPAGVDNSQFMEKLCEAGKVAVLTDGPDVLCFVDTKLMDAVSRQWLRTEALRGEFIIYLTQGCGMSYTDAMHCYRKLATDDGIFAEFATTVKNGEYPPMGVININGHTAQTLAAEHDLNFAQAYDMLLELKNTVQEAEKEDDKGLLGKLFKK